MVATWPPILVSSRPATPPIAWIRIASDITPALRPNFEYLDTNSPTFAALLKLKANRKDDFFERPAGGIDLCAVNPPVRKKPA